MACSDSEFRSTYKCYRTRAWRVTDRERERESISVDRELLAALALDTADDDALRVEEFYHKDRRGSSSSRRNKELYQQLPTIGLLEEQTLLKDARCISSCIVPECRREGLGKELMKYLKPR